MIDFALRIKTGRRIKFRRPHFYLYLNAAAYFWLKN
jgi:hypothetical protein